MIKVEIQNAVCIKPGVSQSSTRINLSLRVSRNFRLNGENPTRIRNTQNGIFSFYSIIVWMKTREKYCQITSNLQIPDKFANSGFHYNFIEVKST